ncbi:MAG: short-chain dehydrogenase [Candidatus Tectomicrobia bacterium RIFCSPLOWO2_02_FULL_70_19]|nr:MAG: short-chain dehydrogenase [Candidatus Tectomicrobia bacterium RIFCSPLOWO2_02_FULL_70_19]
MDLMLRGKVAMISGGSRGLGYHIARGLAQEGCHVAVSARGEARLEEAVRELNALGGGPAAGFCGDITGEGAPEAFLKKTVDEFGGVDILVNNAGGARPGTLLELTEEDWRAAFGLNLFHAVAMCRLAIPEMKKRGGGSILNVASIYGRETGGSMTYNASKAALISFTKALAQQAAKDNIRVNSIAPGSILFPGGSWDRRVKEAPDSLKGFIQSDLPLGRFGRPEELAAAAVFMLSPRASLVHGVCWTVDGGQSRSNI